MLDVHALFPPLCRASASASYGCSVPVSQRTPLGGTKQASVRCSSARVFGSDSHLICTAAETLCWRVGYVLMSRALRYRHRRTAGTKGIEAVVAVARF
jgi:hypothetical protein